MHILSWLISWLIFGLFMVSGFTMAYQTHEILGGRSHNKWALRLSGIGCVLYGLLLAITYTLAGFLHMTYLIPGNYSTNTIAIFSVIFIVVTTVAISNLVLMWNWPVAKAKEEKEI